MTDSTMLDRIREADIVSIGWAYCDFCGLPWLSWPLPSTNHDHADWLDWVIDAVATAPVCGRTRADVLTDLRRIDHAGLARTLAKLAPGGSDG